MKRVLCFLILTFTFAGFSFAQAAQDDTDTQSWNDLLVTVPMSKRFDFFLQGTLRFTRDISRVGEKRIAVGYVWKPNAHFSVSPFYWNIQARNANGDFRQEHRLNLRLNYKFPIKKFGLSHRSWFEYRMRRPLDSWRYRPSLTVEKDIKFIPKSKLFVTEEVFYDSLAGKFSRSRIQAGINKTLNDHLSVDIYYTHQADGYVHPGDLNVVGTTWRVKL